MAYSHNLFQRIPSHLHPAEDVQSCRKVQRQAFQTEDHPPGGIYRGSKGKVQGQKGQECKAGNCQLRCILGSGENN